MLDPVVELKPRPPIVTRGSGTRKVSALVPAKQESPVQVEIERIIAQRDTVPQQLLSISTEFSKVIADFPPVRGDSSGTSPMSEVPDQPASISPQFSKIVTELHTVPPQIPSIGSKSGAVMQNIPPVETGAVPSVVTMPPMAIESGRGWFSGEYQCPRDQASENYDFKFLAHNILLQVILA
jgi:hypothetical protein